MQESWIRSLGQEDSLEKEKATQSSILAWRILWTEEPAGYSPWGHKELEITERLTLTLTEVSQTEKDKYYMIPFVCGIFENDTNELICKTEIESQT